MQSINQKWVHLLCIFYLTTWLLQRGKSIQSLTRYWKLNQTINQTYLLCIFYLTTWLLQRGKLNSVPYFYHGWEGKRREAQHGWPFHWRLAGRLGNRAEPHSDRCWMRHGQSQLQATKVGTDEHTKYTNSNAMCHSRPHIFRPYFGCFTLLCKIISVKVMYTSCFIFCEVSFDKWVKTICIPFLYCSRSRRPEDFQSYQVIKFWQTFSIELHMHTKGSVECCVHF